MVFIREENELILKSFFFLREKKNMKLGGYRGGEELGEEKEYDHNILFICINMSKLRKHTTT